MSNQAKAILQLLGAVLVFFLVAPYLLRGFLYLATKPRVVLEYNIAVRGRVTGSYANRQFYLHYLNGDTKQYYDFNGFERPLTPAEKQLMPAEQHLLTLPHFLEVGDSVTKAANDTTLLVQRGNSFSRWYCSKLVLVE